MSLPSKFLDRAVEQLSSLPGIGKRTALRMALQLLKRDKEEIEAFSLSIIELKQNTKECEICNNISDTPRCAICSNPSRDNSIALVVHIKDGSIQEVIFALIPTMEGDTPNFYLYKKIAGFQVFISTLSRGVAVGTELQYADELTLGRSLAQRQEFKM